MMFADFVRKKRELKGLRIAELARKAGVAPSYISVIEHGRKVPRITNAIRICKALSLDVGVLHEIQERRFKPGGFLKKGRGRPKTKRRKSTGAKKRR